ncbi:MAG: S8 family serine peptidase [bacterium]
MKEFSNCPMKTKSIAFAIFILLIVLPITKILFAHDNGQREKAKKKTERNLSSLRSQIGFQANTQFSDKERQVLDGVIVVKFREQVNIANKSFSSIDKKLNKHNVYAIKKALPFLDHSTKKMAKDLRRIYYFNYSSGENPKEVAMDFAIDPNIEYAEPKYLYKLNATPNDSFFTTMLQFTVVDAPDAWDIIKGDSGNVVIAIVDGGTDWEHEDLIANIWNNSEEIPDNGLDDDDNGFIDDVHGWNFANNSNNPKGLTHQTTLGQHGTHTAGIACAVTDNKIGVASISWNCTLMPINAAFPQGDEFIAFFFEGLAYAADNGADIISLSLGGPGPPSLFENDVINFAFENGSLVVAAAGNDGSNNDITPHFPSNYNHVLAVGATTNTDRKAGFSNYGVTVDVFAPGVGINSTQPDNQYSGNTWQGTSMSTPFVAGIAGLVKTLHPDWTVDQIREQVRVTAENIDSRNPSLSGLLGKGRVNAFQALTLSDLPAIRIVESSFTVSGDDERIDVGETVDLTVRFTNYLENASNVSITITSDDPNITLSNAISNFSTLNTNDTLTVNFQFNLLNTVNEGHVLRFITDISADNYSDRDFFLIVANPPQFTNHDTGTLQTSITTQGNIGFIGFAEESPGVGFVFDGSNFLFEGGLMLGTGPTTVSDCIRGADGSTQDDDFRPVSILSVVSPGEFADQEGLVLLEDSLASNPLGLEITQETFAYTSEPFNDFVIFKYTILNKGSATLTNLFAGLFFDWDITSLSIDFARFDQLRNMGYVQNSSNNPTKLAATKIVTSPGVTSYRSIHNENEIYGGDDRDGFTDLEKWNFLSKGIQTKTIDETDVSTLTSTGPFTLAPEQSVEIAFAVIGASSIDDLLANSEAAQFLWDNELIAEIDLNPPNITTSVLQNPAVSKYADIVVVSDKTLKNTPTVKIWVGSDTTSVDMSVISGTITIYKGAFEFTESGTYTIQTNAVGLINGVDSTQTRSFAVTLAKPGISTSLSTLNNKAILQIDQHSIQEETYFTADYQEVDNEMIFQFGPQKEFNKPLYLELIFDETTFPDVSKLFIYQKEDETWKPLRSQVFPTLHKIKAQVFKLGEFKISLDPGFDGTNLVPKTYSLKQNYPNPFNPITTIEYDLPEDGLVVITVFNSLGQKVKTLYNGHQLAGSYKVHWDATNETGHQVSSGVYFYRLKAEKVVKTNKMILLR